MSAGCCWPTHLTQLTCIFPKSISSWAWDLVPHLILSLGSPPSMSWGFLLQLIIYQLLLNPRHAWCLFLVFTAFSGAAAQYQQQELLVLPLQHYQRLHRERKESWELIGMGTKGDTSTWGNLGLQPPKIHCWDVSSKPPEPAHRGGI